MLSVDISDAVDGYLCHEPDADATRRGNVMARMRMIALFDLSARERAIPLGTGNKTERLFGSGYFGHKTGVDGIDVEVRYGDSMQHSDFENAVYRRSH